MSFNFFLKCLINTHVILHFIVCHDNRIVLQNEYSLDFEQDIFRNVMYRCTNVSNNTWKCIYVGISVICIQFHVVVHPGSGYCLIPGTSPKLSLFRFFLSHFLFVSQILATWPEPESLDLGFFVRSSNCHHANLEVQFNVDMLGKYQKKCQKTNLKGILNKVKVK